MNTTIGNFDLWVTTTLSQNPEYRLCRLTERKPEYKGLVSIYINLHRDDRFSFINFKYPPDEKKLSKEEFDVKAIEYRDFEHSHTLLGLPQPLWKLHVSTVALLKAKLEELSNV